MKILKNSDLSKCLKTIIAHCDEDCIWSDETLDEFCKKSENVQILYALKNKNYIDVLDTNCLIETVILLDEGQYFFLHKETMKKEKLFSFFSQFATGFLSGAAVAVVSTLLVQYLEKQ